MIKQMYVLFVNDVCLLICDLKASSGVSRFFAGCSTMDADLSVVPKETLHLIFSSMRHQVHAVRVSDLER
jgi:hypothetical protein